MIQITNIITRRPRAQCPESVEINNIERLGHKIRKLFIGGAIHKLNFPIEDELLKKTQSNSVVLGISNMRKTSFSLSDSSRIIFSDANWKVLRHLRKFHQEILKMNSIFGSSGGSVASQSSGRS